MANPDRRLGLIGVASLAGLAGGTMFLTAEAEYRRLEAQRTSIITSSSGTTVFESPRYQEINKGMESTLFLAAGSGVILSLSVGSLLAVTGLAISPKGKPDSA